MDEVLYLEPDEEITSIIDKLKETPASSVALVVPKMATIFQSLVNLKLLKKEAEVLNKKIALVTSDSVGHNLASQVGIPVFKDVNTPTPLSAPPRQTPPSDEIIEIDLSLKNAPRPKVAVHHFQEEVSAAPSPQKEIPKPQTAGRRFTLRKISPKFWAALILVLLILAAVYLLLPRTTVVLGVKTSPLEEQVEVNVDSGFKDENLELSILPGTYSQLEDKIEKKVSSSGKKNVGEKASGEITVSNKTGNAVKISQSSRFQSTGGLIFLSNAEISVPAATASVDSEGNVRVNPGQATAKVTAENSGEKYNLDPQKFTILDIDQSKRDNIFGQSQNKFSGGTTREITVVSKDDLENAKKELSDTLFQKLKEEIQKKVGKKRLLDDASSFELLEFSADSKENSEKSEFTAQAKGKLKTLSFLEEDFRKLIVSLLQKKLPADRMLLLQNEDEIIITVSQKEEDLSKMKLSAKIKTRSGPKLSEDSLKTEISGKKIALAQQTLENKPEIETAKITIAPSFFGKVSRLKRQVKIRFEYLQQSQSEENKK